MESTTIFCSYGPLSNALSKTDFRKKIKKHFYFCGFHRIDNRYNNVYLFLKVFYEIWMGLLGYNTKLLYSIYITVYGSGVLLKLCMPNSGGNPKKR